MFGIFCVYVSFRMLKSISTVCLVLYFMYYDKMLSIMSGRASFSPNANIS